MAIRPVARTCFKCLFILLYFTGSEAGFQSTLTRYLNKSLPDEARFNFTQLAGKYGHTAQQYDVVTEDGYILTTFRIPGKKPPVLLFHGLADTADCFILSGHNSLAIHLADAGYEVWAGNARGNKYSRRHTRLDPDTDSRFWNYSFHEIGYYDLAATIDFIRHQTGEDGISVIGHSQGSITQLVLTSLRPEYNSRIKVSIALAPGVFFYDSVKILSFFSSVGPIFDLFIPSSYQEVMSEDKILSNIFKFICSRDRGSFLFCVKFIMGVFAGPANTTGVDPNFMKVVVGHIPSGIARKNLLHFGQLCSTKRFCQFDYGLDMNLAKYGAVEPPEYDLRAVTMPTALFVGKSDRVVRVKDVEHLRDRLPNVIHFEVMKPNLWNHFDFTWGLMMQTHLFPPILRILHDFNGQSMENSIK